MDGFDFWAALDLLHEECGTTHRMANVEFEETKSGTSVYVCEKCRPMVENWFLQTYDGYVMKVIGR